MRRRNNDWDDLPPTFAPTAAARVSTTAIARPGIEVRPVSPFPWRRGEIEQALVALAADPLAGHLVAGGLRPDGVLLLPDLEAACLVRHAAWRLAGDESLPHNLRSGALAVEKALDEATGGATAACLVRVVADVRRSVGLPTPVCVLPRGARRPVRLLGGVPGFEGLRDALAVLHDVYDDAYRRSWSEVSIYFVDEECTEECYDSMEPCPHEQRRSGACGAAMTAVRDLLERAGAEAWLLSDYEGVDVCPYVVWFRDPADRVIFWEVSQDGFGGEDGASVTAWPLENVSEAEFQEVVQRGSVLPNGRRRNGDDWYDLPPMFVSVPPVADATPAAIVPAPLPPPPQVLAVKVRLERPVRPEDLEAALDLLATDPVDGSLVAAARVGPGELAFRSMETVCRLRHAAWVLAGDETKPFGVRAAALALEKSMDEQSGGLAAVCLERAVAKLHRYSGQLRHGPARRRPLMIGPMPTSLAGFEQVLAALTDVFNAEYEAACDAYSLEDDDYGYEIIDSLRLDGCRGCLRGDCEHINERRDEWAAYSAMEKMYELLERSGAEAGVIVLDDVWPTEYEVWFRRPDVPGTYWAAREGREGIGVEVYMIENLDEDGFVSAMEDGRPPWR